MFFCSRDLTKADNNCKILVFDILFIYNEADMNKIIELAKKHAKMCFKDGVTSMACILKTKKGNFYTGVNVKYKSIWKCICAERVAIAKAVEAGDMEFDAIVTVKYFHETDSYSVVNMCGECRQIAISHAPFFVIVSDKEKVKKVNIDDIFPYPYK